jgi:ATP-dependent Clp protease ATP-binding subunit ClpA
MVKVVDKFITEMNSLISDKNVFVQLSDQAKAYLIDKGFDPKMGARPLHRIIDDKIKRPLSREILFGRLVNGGIVKVEFVNDTLTFDYLDPLPVEADLAIPEEDVLED